MSEELRPYRRRGTVHGESGKECMDMTQEIERLTSRHIARCLDHLGDTIAPVQIASIKRSFRFFAEDIKQVMQG